MIIHDAKSGNNYALDYREMAPKPLLQRICLLMMVKSDRRLALESYLSSGTPGTVHGLYVAHQRFGLLPWNELVKPAIDLAEKMVLS